MEEDLLIYFPESSREHIRLFLVFFLMTFHNISMFIVLCGPYFTNNITLLIFIIGYNIALITGWYIFGGCWLTMLEQKLQGNTDKYADGSEKSYISTYLQEYLGINEKVIYYTFTFIPVFNSIVALCKIYTQFNLILTETTLHIVV